MQFITKDNELSVTHRKGYTLAKLCDPGDGGQVSVIVHESEWAKQYSVPTHTRYFRNRMDAIKFLKKTFK